MITKPFFRALYVALLLLVALTVLLPIVYTVVNTFMSETELRRYYGNIAAEGVTLNPFHFVPDYITLSGYLYVFLETPFYLYKFWVSLFLCACIVAGQVLVSVSGGYAFARFRFPLRGAMFFTLIVIMMMPHQVTLVPNYIVLDKMGLLGSYTGLVLIGTFSAFGVFLMRQVFAGVPNSILEAAKTEGASSWRVLWRVLLPNCKAGAASLVILCFIDNWNMVEQPLVLLKDIYKYPLSVFLANMNTAVSQAGFVCGVLSMVPALLLFLFFKEEMISGIGYSVLK